MKKVIFLLSVFLVFIFAAPVYAETCSTDPIDYDCWCKGNFIATEDFIDNTDFAKQLTNYIGFKKAVNLGENNYLLCFSGDEEKIISSQLDIISNINVNLNTNNRLHVYNLFLYATSSSSFFIGNNVVFKELAISGKPSFPLKILGSNVVIDDSDISATKQAITIEGGEDVQIRNTHLTHVGEQSADSAGVYVEDSKDVAISDNPEGIDGFAYGVFIELGTGVAVSDTTFKITDPLKAIWWEDIEMPQIDPSLVGKKLDGKNSELAIELIGRPPAGVQTCSGKVEIYVNDGKGTISAHGECDIEQSKEDYCLVPPDKEPIPKGKDCPDSYVKYSKKDCIFTCRKMQLTSKDLVQFTYTNTEGDTGISPYRIVDDIPIRASIELITETGSSTGSGVTGGNTETTTNDTTGTGNDPGNSVDSGQKYSGGTSLSGEGAAKLGCSLSAGNGPSQSVELLILLSTILLFIRMSRKAFRR